MLDLTPIISHRCGLNEAPGVLAGYKSKYESCIKIMIEMD